MALDPLSTLFLFTNAKILINTETWLLDQKNFERSEILGFYLYLRPYNSGFHSICFHDTKACELPDRTCSEQSIAAQTDIGPNGSV